MNPARSIPRFAIQSETHTEWSLKRNCSVTPAQLAGLYASLCLVSLGVATGFWWWGAPLVLPFAALELVVVGVAFVAYARHAADRERIRLLEGRLIVELETAGRIQRCEFARESVSIGVRVEPHGGDDQMIEVRGGGQSVRVGRYLRPELRPLLAREIRQALRGG